jgi:hypothetical protein
MERTQSFREQASSRVKTFLLLSRAEPSACRISEVSLGLARSVSDGDAKQAAENGGGRSLKYLEC